MTTTLTRTAIVTAARGWLGTPYLHQGALKGVGSDCLGLVLGLWRELIGPLPEHAPAYSPAWAELDASEPLLNAAMRNLVPVPEARIGAVLLFRWRAGVSAKHCGILSAPGRMIHAHDGASIAEVHLVPGWTRRICGQFDFPGVSD